MQRVHDGIRRAAVAAAALLALTGTAPAMAVGTAAAAPEARAAHAFGAIAHAAGLTEVGHGTLRWLGFRVYRATLWSADGRYAAGSRGPLALSLAYAHRFSRADLIGITDGEWTRLGLADAATRARWSAALERIWTDVEDGDELSALVTPESTRFYRADRLLGAVADPAFGPAYLAIWLDARSRVAGLRAELLAGAAGPRP